MGHLCFMIPKSVLFSSDDGRKYKGKEVHFSTTPTLVGIHMALTDKTANVEKISVQIAFLLHSGMSWGSHNPFRISVRSLSISFSLMQRGERESLGHQKKKINSGHLSACKPQAKTDWVSKSRQKGNPRFHCAVPSAAPIMWLMNLSFWISVFYCWT